jgi:hypothetical protein
MVSLDLILSGSELKRNKKEENKDFVSKITHCTLSNRGISNLVEID